MKFNFIFINLAALIFTTSCSAQPKNGTATSSDGTEIYYHAFGAGDPILIINGGPGMNSEGFQDLAEQLSANNQTIIYDQRGTGKSPLKNLNGKTINMQLMLDDMEALREELNIEKWTILGHSFGGMLASYYATRFPNRIDKLILSSSGGIDLDLLNYVSNAINAKLGPAEVDSVNYWLQKINAGDTSYFARYQRGIHLAPAYVVDTSYIPVIAHRLTQGNGIINQLIWDDLRQISFNCEKGLKEFNRPVLILQGKQDILPEKIALRSQAVFKNSKLVFMEHCAHYGWLDNPEVYFEEVNSFLAKN